MQQSNLHPDGWGIGYFIQQDAYILKSEEPAHESERFRLASSRLMSHAFVVHVRRATVGTPDYLNSHPFRFGRWILAHNGTIFSFDDLLRDWMVQRIRPVQQPLIFGNTDSEHLFHYLLSALADVGVDPAGHGEIDAPLAANALRAAVDALYVRAADGAGDWPILNFILTNGDTFFALRAGKELYLSTQKRLCRDAETCPEARKVCLEPKRPDPRVNHLIVSSECIGDEDIWEEMPQGQMVFLGHDFRLGFLDPPEHFALSKIAS